MTPFTDVYVYTREGCSRCRLLKNKLHDAGILFHEVTKFDVDQLIADGFTDLPLLSVDGRLMEYFEACRWIREAMTL